MKKTVLINAAKKAGCYGGVWLYLCGGAECVCGV